MSQYAVKPRSHDQKDHLDNSDCGHKQALSKTVWLVYAIKMGIFNPNLEQTIQCDLQLDSLYLVLSNNDQYQR